MALRSFHRSGAAHPLYGDIPALQQELYH